MNKVQLTLTSNNRHTASVEVIKKFAQPEYELLETSSIRKFKDTLDQLRKECLAQYIKKLDQAGYEAMQLITGAMVQKILAIPAVQLRQACRHDHARALGETLNQLFNLKYQDNSKLKAN